MTAGEDCVVIVCDAHALERNMNLVLQICEVAPHVVMCLNFADEAEKKGIKIDCSKLEKYLHIPVIRINARKKKGFDELKIKAGDNVFEKPFKVSYGKHMEKAVSFISDYLEKTNLGINSRYAALRLLENDSEMWQYVKSELDTKEFGSLNLYSAYSKAMNYLDSVGISRDKITEIIPLCVQGAAHYLSSVCTENKHAIFSRCESSAEKLLTGKLSGFALMFLMLGAVFYITLKGSNFISGYLSDFFFSLEAPFEKWLLRLGVSSKITDMLVFGGYRILAWVVAVMLPPMAIFFPLFTILEDVGYLPRVAFNVDRIFKKCCACGKQALTTCMGFGCNAVGITGARIIDSPRERLIAILTNSFIPCNGRFPALICLITIFFAGTQGGIATSLWLVGFILLGVLISLVMSYILSKTLLKGIPSSFAIELPRFRNPQFGQILVRSLVNRTLKIMLRAVVVAFPAGIIIWILSNVRAGDRVIVSYVISFFEPLGKLMGLDGVILTAFILGIVANEIVLPISFMLYSGGMVSDIGISQASNVLLSAGWTKTTALCAILFFIMHWPCVTSLMTIKKETGSFKWTLVSFLMPMLCGICVCTVVNLISGLM